MPCDNYGRVVFVRSVVDGGCGLLPGKAFLTTTLFPDILRDIIANVGMIWDSTIM